MNLKYVNQAIPKLDGAALTGGKGVYTEDMVPRDCLVVQVLRSPHAHARIKSIRKDAASRVPGISCILTWEDVPQIRYTLAGQSYPEPSPYDRYILERTVRYVGDPVAIVAGRDKDCVARAMRMIQVKYDILEPVLAAVWGGHEGSLLLWVLLLSAWLGRIKDKLQRENCA